MLCNGTASSSCPLGNLKYFRSFDSKVKFEICKIICVCIMKISPNTRFFESRTFPEGYSSCPLIISCEIFFSFLRPEMANL